MRHNKILRIMYDTDFFNTLRGYAEGKKSLNFKTFCNPFKKTLNALIYATKQCSIYLTNCRRYAGHNTSENDNN